jgi:hypothetical protein
MEGFRETKVQKGAALTKCIVKALAGWAKLISAACRSNRSARRGSGA